MYRLYFFILTQEYYNMSKSNPLANFKKSRNKIKGVITDSRPPQCWLSTGFKILNKTISGSYEKGYAGGRLAMLTGPSSSGKSLLAIAAAVEAQKQGYGVFIVDTEHALDDEYMEAIGLNVDDELFFYQKVNSISNAKKVMSSFIDDYRSNKDDLPPFVMLVDSLDQLKTESHVGKAEDGEIYNDQGLHAKQLKQMCSDWAQDIGDLDIFGIATKQPYKNQDPIMSKVKPWIITDALRFPFSQIILATNVFLKDKATKVTEGIKLTAFADKTRFCKPFQKCVVEVPYDIGIDPYNGILYAAASIGVVDKNGSWYIFNGHKFQYGGASEHIEDIYKKLLEVDEDKSIVFDVPLDDSETEDHKIGKSVSKKKKKTTKKPANLEDADE